MTSLRKANELAHSKHPKNIRYDIQYGTAGFREKADTLDHVMYRMGLLAVLRSKYKKATIGVMITASHNPEADNGVKLVDPKGEMLDESWEKLATDLANAEDDCLEDALKTLIASVNIDMSESASVLLGRDSRPSSPSLAQAVLDGISVLEGKVSDFGIVTTPMLHYFVVCRNTAGEYGEPTEEGYYIKLTGAFKKLRGERKDKQKYVPKVLFDGANGVGALKMKLMNEYLGDNLHVEFFNSGDGVLNYMCGADYVKVSQKPPLNVPVETGVHCVSVDGDADRIIYSYVDKNNKFHIMDGDRIATLVAEYLMELVTKSGLSLNLGIVQTAYANGNSTNYISKTLKVPVACVSPGVKHLHHKAMEYDIGVYFEANGHGTIVFSDNATKLIRNAASNQCLTPIQRTTAEHLASLIDVINQTVGDAISDMLLVETILYAKDWSIDDWAAAYTDLPSRLMKVSVKDRNVIQTTDAARKCVSPAGLQEAIDELITQYKDGRSFVRSSGTEDVVRVYAEADTQDNADRLASEVALKVHRLAGGVGEAPKVP